MSSTNITTTQTISSPRLLLDIEDTTSQQHQSINADMDNNNEGFIDADMSNNIDNEDTNQQQQQADSDSDYNSNIIHETNILDRSMSNNDPNGIWDDSIDEIEGVEEEEEEYSSPQQLEMAPLIEEENDLDEIPIADERKDEMISTPVDQPPTTNTANTNNPPSPKPIAMQIMRSRRKASDIQDNTNDSHQTNNRSSTKQRLTCLKRKKSRDNQDTIEYEQLTNGDMTDTSTESSSNTQNNVKCGRKIRRLCSNSTKQILRTTVSIMNFLSKVLLYGSIIALIIGIVWYSRELKYNGTDAHLIAWFSAGAFVLLGFPISMCGIIMHLKNYYQPNVQCYVVRILWMVPIYSIESWLCLRFHEIAIYIETLRDVYESYVLYSFFQFLIEVLGGEETLVLILKDKSPTRGCHIWGLGYCIKPWAMGQPVSRRVSYTPDKISSLNNGGMANNSSNGGLTSPHHQQQQHSRAIKKVQWMSPFFVKCKFGVLQYVLLKFVSSIFVMVLEMYDLYKEGDFTPRGGYLYICILTNLSQCWALYCLVFFYYALKNELGPIRPVGKFLSVKALVFFTWWQSLGISILFQMGMIPHYTTFDSNTMGDQIDGGKEWSSEDVAKGLQDWLICIEMFCAAIVHTFVFPHTDYMEPLGIMNQRQNSTPNIGSRRLGRKGRLNRVHRGLDDRSMCSKSSGETDNLILGSGFDIELGDTAAVPAFNNGGGGCSTVDEMSDKESTCSSANIGSGEMQPARHERQGFVRALLDSTVPRDVLDESVGIFKGKYNDEKKTLLHHAATSDEYDLFSKSSKRRKVKLGRKTKVKEGGASVPDSVLLSD